MIQQGYLLHYPANLRMILTTYQTPTSSTIRTRPLDQPLHLLPLPRLALLLILIPLSHSLASIDERLGVGLGGDERVFGKGVPPT